MELRDLFKRVNDLTGKHPGLNTEEIKELRLLSNRLSAECSNMIYDTEVEKRNED